jgi:peptidoglycan/xylan/chitin deacetylase (PgdA/CDA1 family)
MIYILVASAVFIGVLIWLNLEYSIFIPAGKGIRILMYHKVSDGHADGITIPAEKLRVQLEYLRKKGYHSISFEDLSSFQKTGKPLPSRPVILTFDDAYRDFMERAFPILEKADLKASVFIPVGYLGKTNVWDQGSDPILNVEEIKSLANSGRIEFGLHSFLHRNYAEMDAAAIEKDLQLCIQALEYHLIPFTRVLAYPYGQFPRKDKELNAAMKEIFRNAKLLFALRIGNRINGWPVKDPFELKRIDIRGTDNFYTFRTKLRKGRRKLFS